MKWAGGTLDDRLPAYCLGYSRHFCGFGHISQAQQSNQQIMELKQQVADLKQQVAELHR